MIIGVVQTSAQTSQEAHLPLDGWISEDGRNVHLTWTDTPRAHRGRIEVSRRPYGAVGGATWRPITVQDRPGLHVVDTSTQAGQAYEYRLVRTAQDILDVGYWLTGRNIPVVETRGIVHVVVDQTIAEPLQLYLSRFRRDLNGDGWRVKSYLAPRHVSQKPQVNLRGFLAIKNQLQAVYAAEPSANHVLILVGHLPMIRSGKANPDGHQAVSITTDLLYGDLDGRWRVSPDGEVLENQLPSDAIEMQVGRIDFATVSEGNRAHEEHLLRSYFDKNHNWRHARLGDLRQGYGQDKNLIGEKYALRNIIGPRAISRGGHHDLGEQHPWLWGVDFGHHNGRDYPERYENKAIFALNFGSHKHKIATAHNAMTALLAQPWYPLAVGWGGRPTWWLHHMALGGTIGDVHMRTVNNGAAAKPYRDSMDYFPTGPYLWRNPVWVNLLGDPTLRAFPLKPPTEVRATSEPDKGVRLVWTSADSTNALGYHVYKARPDGAEFVRISGDQPVSEKTFLDSEGTDQSLYMVRTYGKKTVHAGSFYTLSQGVFAQVGRPPIVAHNPKGVVQSGEVFDFSTLFNMASGGAIAGFVDAPVQGRLRFENGQWRYQAPSDFSGTVGLRFVVSDTLTSDEGIVTLTVSGP